MPSSVVDWFNTRNSADQAWDAAKCGPSLEEAISWPIGIALVGILLLICWCNGEFDRQSADESDPTEGPAVNRNSGRHSNPEAPDKQGAFALVNAHFLDAHEALSGTGPAEGWTGGAGAGYEVQNAVLRNQLRRVAETNTHVDATVQTQSEQVTSTRATLDNLLDGLQAAIPVAHALYFSGPAGPALSYNFQLSVATPAMSTATDTTNTMEQNAQGHAKRLTALTQEYSNAFQAISTTDSTGSPTSQFSTAITVDPDYINKLAPIHRQAANTFAAAGNTVRGSAEAISAAHGRICDASKDALANAERAHNTLATAMHKYSTGLAAALPAAASAYADTDEWATKSLNSQLA